MKARKKKPRKRKRGKTPPKSAPNDAENQEDGFEGKRGPVAGAKASKIHRAIKQPRQRKSG